MRVGSGGWVGEGGDGGATGQVLQDRGLGERGERQQI